MYVIAEYQSLVKKTTDVNLGGKKLFLPAKTFCHPSFFSTKKTFFFPPTGKNLPTLTIRNIATK